MQYSETQKKQAPKEEEQSWWDKTVAFAKDNAGALVSGALVVGGGALCLTGVGSGFGAAMIADWQAVHQKMIFLYRQKLITTIM